MNSACNNNYNAVRKSYQTTRIGKNTFFFFFPLVSYYTWLISPTAVKTRMSLLVACAKLRCTRVKIIWLFNFLPFDVPCVAGSPAEQAAGDAWWVPGPGCSLPCSCSRAWSCRAWSCRAAGRAGRHISRPQLCRAYLV